jgi:hypothetical protein
MAKDDFHFIAYRILKYLYECLKKGEKPEEAFLTAGYLLFYTLIINTAIKQHIYMRKYSFF